MADRTIDDIQALGPWFHNLHLPDGRQTAPDHFLGDFPRIIWDKLADTIPTDLGGWTALDIGCNAGFYTFELAKRGATVTALDHDPRYLRQAQWAAQQYELTDQIEFLCAEVYELPQLERQFDLILFMGTLYHLRYPLLALDFVASAVRRKAIVQTLTMPGPSGPNYESGAYDPPIHDREHMLDPAFPKMAFIEDRFAGDPTNWWVPNPPCVEAMLRSSGLGIVARPAREVYVCEPAPELAGGGRAVASVQLAGRHANDPSSDGQARLSQQSSSTSS